MTSSEFSTWAFSGIPPALFAISLIALLVKQQRRRKNPSAQYTWEPFGAMATLTLTLVGAQLSLSSLETRKVVAEAKAEIVSHFAPNGFLVTEAPTGSRIIRSEHETLMDFSKDSDVHLTRALFHPLPLPGVGESSDYVVGRALPSGQMGMTQIVGYPTNSDGALPRTLSNQRRLMQLYLFAFLTSPTWKDKPHEIIVLYLPWTRPFDTWAVSSTARSTCGFVFFRGTSWSPDSPPSRSNLTLVSGQDAFSRGVADDHLRLQEESYLFLRQQMQLPAYSRAPCTVFCSDGPEGGLRPTSLDEIRQELQVRAAQWDESTLGERPLPRTLSELSEVITLLTDQSR